MQPDNNRSNNPIVPQRNSSLHIDPRQNNGQAQAANVVRGQIDHIYTHDPNSTMEQPEQSTPNGAVDYKPQSQEPINPYERTRETTPQDDSSAWQKYHSAWQNYYQQYYERYYVSQVNETKHALEDQAQKERSERNSVMTEQEAIYELRKDLIGKVRQQATVVRKSKHFWPIMASAAVMLVFLFLQYNRVLFANVAAYVRPSSVNQANVIVDPNDTSTITKEDRLIIPSISVDVPIIWGANAADQNSLNAAMDKGVVWFNVKQAHSKPGENGNFVVSGHSSNDWMDQGDYKFVFAPLEQMKVGDTFYVNYQQKRYVYRVSHTQVVKPTDINSLQTDNSKPVITLITCTPLGTALNRLLVFADQISPDPSIATAPSMGTNSSAGQMPTNSPTFFERMFGG
jgi:sortase A